MKEQVRGWFNHYKHSQNFKSTLQSHKVDALTKYLSKSKCHGFNATRTTAKAMLIEIMEEEETGEEKEQGIEMADELVQEEDNQISEGDEELIQKGGQQIMEGVNESEYPVIEEETGQTERKQTVESRKQYNTKCEYLSKTDKELFEDENIPDFVRKTYQFNERKKVWNEKEASSYITGKTSSELFQKLSTTPPSIQETKTFKKRISELSNNEKSMCKIADSVNEIIEALKKNQSPKNKELVKVISAAITSSKYGPPDLSSLSRREEESGVKMRERLMSGKDISLTSDRKVKRQIFPAEVVTAARTHWEQVTVTEPALHKRSGPSSATVQVQ